MRPQQLFPIVLSVILSILVTACKDDPVSPNEKNALKGTWLVESVNGANAASLGATWKFDESTASYTQADEGCRTAMTYTTSGDKLFMTLTSNSCGDGEPGTRDTATWSIANGKLTVKQDGNTVVLRRPSGTDRIVGTWQVTKINGAGLPNGAGMWVVVNDTRLGLSQLRANQSTCSTLFTYDISATVVELTVENETCGELQVGQSDTVRWVVDGDRLALTFSDNTKIEADRL